MKRNYYLIFGIIVVVAAAAVILYSVFNKSSGGGTASQQFPPDAIAQPVLKEAIDGELVSDVLANRRPVAIMVENHPDARPQSGLGDADIVYETLAEGGITRFMAVYQSREPDSIGPIRSAREYYVDLAEELHAIYVHVGGSDKALANLSAGVYKDVTDLNEFYNGGYFTRIKTRVAPHNAYNGIARIGDWILDKKIPDSASYDPWLFKDGPEADANMPTISHIVADFSTLSYKAEYNYDAATNTYKRLLAGKPHSDADTKEQLSAVNVVVQHVTVADIPNDPKLRIAVNLKGSGKAEVYRDGRRIDAVWRKTGDGRTRYFDATGQEVRFNRGNIWVELVPN